MNQVIPALFVTNILVQNMNISPQLSLVLFIPCPEELIPAIPKPPDFKLVLQAKSTVVLEQVCILPQGDLVLQVGDVDLGRRLMESRQEITDHHTLLRLTMNSIDTITFKIPIPDILRGSQNGLNLKNQLQTGLRGANCSRMVDQTVGRVQNLVLVFWVRVRSRVPALDTLFLSVQILRRMGTVIFSLLPVIRRWLLNMVLIFTLGTI